MVDLVAASGRILEFELTVRAASIRPSHFRHRRPRGSASPEPGDVGGAPGLPQEEREQHQAGRRSREEEREPAEARRGADVLDGDGLADLVGLCAFTRLGFVQPFAGMARVAYFLSFGPTPLTFTSSTVWHLRSSRSTRRVSARRSCGSFIFAGSTVAMSFISGVNR